MSDECGCYWCQEKMKDIEIPMHKHETTCDEDFCENCGDCLSCYGISDGYCEPCYKPTLWYCCEQAMKEAQNG